MVSRHREPVLAYVLVVLTAVVVVTALTPKEFRSESKLLVGDGREAGSFEETSASREGGTTSARTREAAVNSWVEMLRSRALRERVVDAFGPDAILGRESKMPAVRTRLEDARPTSEELDRAREEWRQGRAGGPGWPVGSGMLIDPRPEAIIASWFETITLGTATSEREKALARFARRLRVSAHHSSIISIGYDAASPQLAQAIVTKVVETCLDQHARLIGAQTTPDFLAIQTDELRARLTQAEQEFHALKDEAGVASIADERRIVAERIGHLEDDALSNQSQLALSRAEAAAIASRLRRIPERIEPERGEIDAIRRQLASLQLRERELLTKNTQEMPAVREIQRQIREMRQILESEEARRARQRSRNPVYEQLNLSLMTAQARVASLEAKANLVRRQIQEAKASLKALHERELRLTQAERELELQEANYRRHAEGLQQARVDRALELERLTKVRVLQPATLEERPIRPRPAINLTIGLLGALLGSLGLAFVAERADGASSVRRLRPPTHPDPRMDDALRSNRAL